jgi:pimeloyl-ACP methyl ester carboxylesterase
MPHAAQKTGPGATARDRFESIWSSALAGALVLCLGASASTTASAEPAGRVLGRDFEFPNRLEGLPTKLSDFPSLQINHFITNDGVKLAYWEAGQGRPIIFVPGWSANGAEYINVMYLLSKQFRVIVLDPRNQGLSQHVNYGNRIARFAVDLNQLVGHLKLKKADFCGWSMGASVIWSYIDQFGTASIRKACFVDEPISIVSHPDWTEAQKRDAGSIVTSPEQVLAAFSAPLPANPSLDDPNLMVRSTLRDSPYFANSEDFARAVVHDEPSYTALVMWDHASSDWRDVVQHKIDVPTAIFTGEYSANVPSQRWAHSVIKGSQLHVYTKAEQGDHFLMFKNPRKFTQDLTAFLNGNS